MRLFHLLRPASEERTRQCQCPIWLKAPGCAAGHLIEEHPRFVVPATYLPWGYKPRGPYRLQMWHESMDPAQIEQHCVVDDLLGAVDLFVSRFLPPQFGYYTYLIDERYNCILGYDNSTFANDKTGTLAWWGVQEAFDCLTPLVGDPMTVAIWESMARDQAR